MWGCVFSVYPFPLWWLGEYIYFVLLSSLSGKYELLLLSSSLWLLLFCKWYDASNQLGVIRNLAVFSGLYLYDRDYTFVMHTSLVGATLCFIANCLGRAYRAIFNTWRPRQNGPHFADDIFKRIFVNETIWIPINFSLNFVAQGSINNIAALVQIIAWRRPGDKPLSEPMMDRLPTHICITRPQWVNK